MDLAERFLEHACLTYSGDDAAARRAPAVQCLTEHPDLGRDDLHVASALGRVENVRDLLSRGETDPDREDGPRQWEPLLYLAYSRVHAPDAQPVAAAQALLDAGANPNASFRKDGASFTVLTGLLGQGEQGLEAQPSHPHAGELAKLLLDRGAQANDSQGLYNTMFVADDSWLELLLSHGLGPEDPIGWDMGIDPAPRTLDFLLAHAVEAGFEPRVDLLLEHGADPGGVSPYHGRRYYTSALLHGRTRIAERLAAAGAPTEPGNPDERMRLACQRGDAEEARRILQDEPALLEDPSLLIDAASRGSFSTVQLLLDLGAPVGGLGKGGASALHHAALGGHEQIARLLLERGADPHQVEPKFDAKASGWAMHGGHPELARLLEA